MQVLAQYWRMKANECCRAALMIVRRCIQCTHAVRTESAYCIRLIAGGVCLQTEATRAGVGAELPCRLMRVGGVVRQARVLAFDVNNQIFSLPLCRQDLIFKIRHGRSRLLDFGTKYTTLLFVQS